MPKPKSRIEIDLLDHQIEALDSESVLRLLLCGIGAGKTHGAVLIAWLAGMSQPGVEAGFTAPSYKIWKRVDWPVWQKLIPPETYHWWAGDQCIELINGTRLWCMGTKHSEQRIVGDSWAFCIADELDSEPDPSAVDRLADRLRGGDRPGFLLGLTSPHGHAWLGQWAQRTQPDGTPAVHVINASTYDNPHLPEWYITLLETQYPPGTRGHAQHMLGQLIERTGLLYGTTFARDAHLVPLTYDFAAPYDLGWDPGKRASGQVAFQELMPHRQVVVREWTPRDEGTDITARRIKRAMGKSPKRIFMDTYTKTSTSRAGLDDKKALAAIFPGAEIHVVQGRRRRSGYRHEVVDGALARGDLLIASHLAPDRVTTEERGLVYALETMPYKHEAERDESLDEKDPRKHVLDALEFGAVHLLPLQYPDQESRARRLRQAKVGRAA